MRQCDSTGFRAPIDVAPGTLCKGGVQVHTWECSNPSTVPPPQETPKPVTVAPTTPKPTTSAPTSTPKPTTSAPVSTPKPSTSAPATAPPSEPVTVCRVSVSQNLLTTWTDGTNQKVYQYGATLLNSGANKMKVTVKFSATPLSYYSIGAGANGAYDLKDYGASGIVAGESYTFGYTTYSATPLTVTVTCPTGSVSTPAPATSAPATSAPVTSAPATSAPTSVVTSPPVSATTKPDTPVITNPSDLPFGQLLMAYYSGVAPETIGAGGVNALALSFFDPVALAGDNCNFNDENTPCVAPAAQSGNKNLKWALDVFAKTIDQMKPNTAPVRNQKPTIFFSFGGEAASGGGWDNLLGNEATARKFAQNAAKLVRTVYEKINGKAFVGFDLDVEGMKTEIPHLKTFVQEFRKTAPFSIFPLQLCTLSGLADPSNDDHFKIEIMKQVGPAQGGINFLNLMVANLDFSCVGMSNFWLHKDLAFIPDVNKVFGMWGTNNPGWILHNPGCNQQGADLFKRMKDNKISVGIWQWWAGPTEPVTSVLNAVRSS